MKKSDIVKLAIGYCLGLAAAWICFCVARQGGKPLDLLIFVAGGTIGWSLGLYVTPTSEGEKKILSDGTRTVLALLTGIGVGSTAQWWPKIKQWWLTPDELPTRLLVFVCMVMVGTLMTYVGRLFWTGSDEELKRARLKAIEDAQAALEKLRSNN